jgi:hypothetical protein
MIMRHHIEAGSNKCLVMVEHVQPARRRKISDMNASSYSRSARREAEVATCPQPHMRHTHVWLLRSPTFPYSF